MKAVPPTTPVKARPLTVDDLSNSVNRSGPPDGEFGEDSYDEEFLKEIDGMALDASISEEVIPTIFHTPRVSGGAVSSSSGGAVDAVECGCEVNPSRSNSSKIVLSTHLSPTSGAPGCLKTSLMPMPLSRIESAFGGSRMR